MSTWAENAQEEIVYDDGNEQMRYLDNEAKGAVDLNMHANNVINEEEWMRMTEEEQQEHHLQMLQQEQEEYDEQAMLDDEALWDSAKVVVDHEVDVDGNKYEIVKKVRQHHEDRPTTAADIRAKFAPYGKAKEDQSMLISHEAPMALEMGDADQFERESRNEVKRMLNEAMTMEVKVKDPHLQLVVRKEEAKKAAAAAAAATALTGESSGADGANYSAGTGSSGAGTATWGANRTARIRPGSDRSQVYKRRIRLTNVSDDITEANLEAIFNINDCIVSRVRISKDDVTQKNRGFAFIEFREEWMVDETLKRKERYMFKNVIMQAARATEDKWKKN